MSTLDADHTTPPQPAPPSRYLWPLPPFFRQAEGPPDEHAWDGSIELLNGRLINAVIDRFDPAADGVSVSIPGHAGSQRLKLDNVRVIRLTTPLALVRDVDLLNAVGALEAHVADHREVIVRFRDGKTLVGITRGFIREKAGLFLYMLAGEPLVATRCFIPAHQLDDVQIGLLMGDTLVANSQVGGEAVDEALNKQATLRRERVGKLLLNRGIITQDDLKNALQAQKQMPVRKLGDLLLASALITPDQLAQALMLQGNNRKRRLGDILVEMGAISQRLVQSSLSEKLGIPFVNVHDFQSDPLAIGLLGAAAANRFQALPLLRVGNALVVAMENPLDLDVVQELRFLTEQSIVPVIADPKDLAQRIAKDYASLALSSAMVDADNATAPRRADGSPAGRDINLMRVEELASVLARETSPSGEVAGDTLEEAHVTDNALVRLLNKVIIDAYAQGASDIHIESNPGTENTRIRFRKDGVLEDYLQLQPAYRNALVSRIKIMADLNISERRHAQDGKIAFGRFSSVAMELRVAVVPTANGLEDVVLRILGGTEPLLLDALDMHATDLAMLKEMIVRSFGLLLVCGPTGSGKTTTLHSVMHHINRPDLKIWTAEDPVEITQAGLRQVQINARIDWTFAAALRAFLRADPDVIMVGEIRDAETAKTAIEASLTGHLVFSTLHTNSAAESIVRLLDIGMDSFNFADAIIGILAQRLARRLCVLCRQGHNATDVELAALVDEYCTGTGLDAAAVLAGWQLAYAVGGQITLYEAAGCAACHEGYKGRIGIYELLSASDEVKALVRTRGTVPQIVQAGRRVGMRQLHQDAIEKVLRGLIDRKSARTAST